MPAASRPGERMPSAHTLRPFSHRPALALAVLAGALGDRARGRARARAPRPRGSTSVRAEQDRVRAQLAEQNAAVDALLGQVSQLRQREDAVAAELAEQEAKLAAARSDLAQARDALADTKRRLSGAIDELERLLVSIYRSGEPDAATLLLDSEGVDDLATTIALPRAHPGLPERGGRPGPRPPRRRERPRRRGGDVDRAAWRRRARRSRRASEPWRPPGRRSSSASPPCVPQQAAAPRAARRPAGRGTKPGRGAVEAAPDPEPDGAEEPAARCRRRHVAPPSGSQATLNSDGTATAPADAPQAVEDAIAAANSISDAPYTYGGGHGSFESSGYDCSGSVSFALHGGGLLSSPLDSTGFMTWGESGPGSWITVYSHPGSRIRGHRRASLRHLRRCRARAGRAPATPTGFVATHPPGY